MHGRSMQHIDDVTQPVTIYSVDFTDRRKLYLGSKDVSIVFA